MPERLTKTLTLMMLVCAAIAANAQVDIRKNAVEYSAGLECKYKDDTQGAIKHFNEALRHTPDDAASMFELSELYASTANFDEGLSLIKKAVKIEPDNKWYKLRLARFYEILSMKDEMIATYEQLLDEEPQNLELLGELIEALEDIEEYDKALFYLNKVEKELGPTEPITDEKIKIYQQQGKTKKVITELENAIAQQPENTNYQLVLAKLYMDSGKDKDAVKLYQHVKQTDPDDKYASVALLEYYEKKGKKKQAFDELLSTIRNKNLDFNTKASIYEYWFNKAENSTTTDKQALECGQAFIETHPDIKAGYSIVATYFIRQDNDKEAKKMLAKVLQCDSTDFFAWQNLVTIDYIENNYETMTENAVKALQYYPTQPFFYLFAGIGNRIGNNSDAAINYLEKGRRFAVEEIAEDINMYLGDIYHEHNELDKAFEAYDRVLTYNPDNSLVLNNYAYYLSLEGKQLDKALEMAQHAVELSPQTTFIDTYAWVLFKMGRYEDAELVMRKVLRDKKNLNGVYLEHYGDILFMLGNSNEALKYWKIAKEAGKTSDNIDEKIEKGSL